MSFITDPEPVLKACMNNNMHINLPIDQLANNLRILKTELISDEHKYNV